MHTETSHRPACAQATIHLDANASIQAEAGDVVSIQAGSKVRQYSS